MKYLFKDVKRKKYINLSGIYLIKIKHNFYIGSSKNIYNRFKQHSSALKRKKHQNVFLQNCFNKYGEDNCKFVIVQYQKEFDNIELRKLEKLYIDYYNPNINFERNPVTKEVSKESRKKISKTLKDKYKNKEIFTQGAKKVYQYNLNGKFIKCWKSLRTASDYYNMSSGGKISRSVETKGSSAGYQWRYEKYISIGSFNDPHCKKFTTYNIITKEIKTYNSLLKGSVELNIHQSTLRNRCYKNLTIDNIKYTLVSPVPGLTKFRELSGKP